MRFQTNKDGDLGENLCIAFLEEGRLIEWWRQHHINMLCMEESTFLLQLLIIVI